MPESLRACRPGDAFIQPNWRELRAQEAVTVPGRRTDDDLVNAYCTYLENGHSGRYQASIAAALELREPHHADRCSEVKARLLAGQSTHGIATRCGLSEDVVAVFAQLFFDVTGRLKAGDWIATQVLFVECRGESAPERLRGVWSYIGYHHGPLALDAVLAVSRGHAIPDSLLRSTGAARIEEEARVRMQFELLVLTCLATTPEERLKVAELHDELRQRFPESVSEIPDPIWNLFCGSGTKRPKTTASTTKEQKPAAAEPRSRAKTAALIAALLQGPSHL